MVCNDFVVVKIEGGKKYIRGTIYADTMPGTLPMDGTDVGGLSANMVFVVGMTFFTPNETKVLFPGGWQTV